MLGMIADALAALQTQKKPAHASPLKANVSCARKKEPLVAAPLPRLELPIRVRAECNFCSLALLDEPDAPSAEPLANGAM
jgi:hypothetical protein